jgi:hypothetical protein
LGANRLKSKNSQDHEMKPTPIFVAAAGFAMLGACSVETADNAADATDANTTVTDRPEAPAADNTAGTDTLGNQLNQLNESDAVTANETDTSESNSAD